MSGFSALPGALIEQMAPLYEGDVAFHDEQYKDQVALDLVLQDIAYAEQYRSSKMITTELEYADNIYRAYVKPRTWPGSDTARANLGMPLVLEVIDTNLLPTTYNGFFSDPKPFLIEAQGTTTPEAAEATGRLLKWEVDESDFPEEIRKTLKSCFQYGVGVAKWGWKTVKKVKKTYQKKGAPIVFGEGPATQTLPTADSDTVEVKKTEVELACATVEWVDLRFLLVDGSCREQDIRKSRFVVQQNYVTANDLDEMRDQEGYENIPSREALREILTARTEPTTNSHQVGEHYLQPELQAWPKDQAFSVDPLSQPLEILEYWTKDRVITVLQRKLVIRNEENEFGVLPFVSCSFIDVLNSFYGYGVSKLLGAEQLLEQGVVNSYIDGLALKLSPAMHRKKGLGATAQTILLSPGKQISDDADLNPFKIDFDGAEALNAIAASETRAVRRVGAQAGDSMPTQAMRTAEGVQSFTTGVMNRMSYFIDCFARLVFIPILEAFIQMAKDKLKPSQIQQILTDADGKAFEGEILDLYNGQFNLQVLSSTKLAARKGMANLIPMLIQLFQTEGFRDQMEVQHRKVDYQKLINKALDLIGAEDWDLITDMTAEDIAQLQAEQNAAAQQQAAQQQNQKDLIDEKATAQTGSAIVKEAAKVQLMRETNDKNLVTGGDAAAVGRELAGVSSGAF